MKWAGDKRKSKQKTQSVDQRKQKNTNLHTILINNLPLQPRRNNFSKAFLTRAAPAKILPSLCSIGWLQLWYGELVSEESGFTNIAFCLKPAHFVAVSLGWLTGSLSALELTRIMLIRLSCNQGLSLNISSNTLFVVTNTVVAWIILNWLFLVFAHLCFVCRRRSSHAHTRDCLQLFYWHWQLGSGNRWHSRQVCDAKCVIFTHTARHPRQVVGAQRKSNFVQLRGRN